MTAKLNVLLASGHLAMMAIMRMFFQDGFTGSAAGSAQRQLGKCLAAPRCQVQARPLLAVGVHRLFRAGVLGDRRLPVAVHGHQALRRAEQVGRFIEGPTGLLALDRGLLRSHRVHQLHFAQQESIGRMTAKWNALLASGRLAMMAIIRMFFQDGFTGPSAVSAENGCRENVLQRRAAKQVRPLLAVSVHQLLRAGVLEARSLPVAVHGRQAL